MSLIRRSVAIAGAVVLIAFTSLMTYYAAVYLYPPVSAITGDSYDKMLALLSIIEEKFYDEERLDELRLWDGAAQGLLRALDDPYSAYMNIEQYDELLVQTSGSYSGVGISFGIRNRFFTVVAPMRGTPAAEAGIRSGDRILMVDGVDLQDKPTDEVVSLIRGPEGSEVSLTLQRPPAATPFVVTLLRANIQVPATESRMWEDGIGYLQIITFNEHTTRDVALAINQLLDEGAEALIVDLRGNSGGYVHEGVNVASFFIPPGPVVRVTGRERDETYMSHTPALGLPMVLLVDAGTGSTSEIVAGAIQDWEMATLVGMQTYGKGLVQELIRLDDGSGLRLTTAVYLTPLGRHIHEVGITPDVIVEPQELTIVLPLAYEEELEEGAVHWIVMAVQERLAHLGYVVEYDGILHNATVEAIKTVQEDAGMIPDGRINAATLVAIEQALALEEVVDVQLEKGLEILREKMGLQ